MRSHVVPCVTHPPHQWCPRTVCFSPPQGTWSLKSHLPALRNCLCAPSRGGNKPSAGRGQNRGLVFTVNTVGRDAVASALDRLPGAPTFPRGTVRSRWKDCSQVRVPVPGGQLPKARGGHEQQLAPDVGGLAMPPPLCSGLVFFLTASLALNEF